jgi:hypothetical protein
MSNASSTCSGSTRRETNRRFPPRMRLPRSTSSSRAPPTPETRHVSQLSDLVALTIGGNSSRPIPGSSAGALAAAAGGAWRARALARRPRRISIRSSPSQWPLFATRCVSSFPSAVAARHAEAAREKAAQIQRRLHAKFAQLAPIAEAKLPEIESVVEQMEVGLALLGAI